MAFLDELENAVDAVEIPPTPFFQVANTLKAAAKTIQKIETLLGRMNTTIPETKILDKLHNALELLREGDYESAAVILQNLKQISGYCDVNTETQRLLQNLAWLVYLLVKDNLPEGVSINFDDYVEILENADWLLRNYATRLIETFFTTAKEFIEKILKKLDSMLEVLTILATTSFSPCDLLTLIADAEAVVIAYMMSNEKIKTELKERTQQEVEELANAIPQILQVSDVPHYTKKIITNAQTLRSLGESAKRWLKAMGVPSKISVLSQKPPARKAILEMRT